MKVRYSLTINSKNQKELNCVLDEMNRKNAIPTKILKMDACFGPCEKDGSFITMFSSDELSQDGYVKAMDSLLLSNFFSRLAKKLPGNKFTLRGKYSAETATDRNFVQTWNVYKMRDQTQV